MIDSQKRVELAGRVVELIRGLEVNREALIALEGRIASSGRDEYPLTMSRFVRATVGLFEQTLAATQDIAQIVAETLAELG